MNANTRKWFKIGVVLLSMAAVLYGCNSLLFHGYMVQWSEMKKQEVPINIRLVVTDQFGEPAPGYKLALQIDHIAWYYWILPMGGYSGTRYMVKTDDKGVARLHPWFRKGLSIRLEEVQSQNFILPGNAEELGNPLFRDRPIGASVDLLDLGRDEQVIPLHVLKHGSAIKPAPYDPEYPKRMGGGDGFEVEATDTNIFTLDLANNKLVVGTGEGTLRVTVTNAKRACALYRTKPWDLHEKYEPTEWSVLFEGLNNAKVLDAAGVVPIFAPSTGYENQLLYRVCVGPDPSATAVAFTGGIERIGPLKMVETGGTVYLSRTIGSLGRTFYIKNEHPPYYGYIQIDVDLNLSNEGTVLIRTSGFYNPDGSTNLWRGHR